MGGGVPSHGREFPAVVANACQQHDTPGPARQFDLVFLAAGHSGRNGHGGSIGARLPAGWDLGRGESEVLTWAASQRRSQRQALAILDDLAARRCATSLGIEPHGTLFVLLEAKKAGIVPAVAPLIELVRAKGLFVSDSLVAKILRCAGETR